MKFSLHFGMVKPEKKVRVGTGKVRVWYGFGTGSENPRYTREHQVFPVKVRVGMGLVRV